MAIKVDERGRCLLIQYVLPRLSLDRNKSVWHQATGMAVAVIHEAGRLQVSNQPGSLPGLRDDEGEVEGKFLPSDHCLHIIATRFVLAISLKVICQQVQLQRPVSGPILCHVQCGP